MDVFTKILAQYLGNTVLINDACSNVYIAVGIMLRIIDMLGLQIFIEAISR